MSHEHTHIADILTHASFSRGMFLSFGVRRRLDLTSRLEGVLPGFPGEVLRKKTKKKRKKLQRTHTDTHSGGRWEEGSLFFSKLRQGPSGRLVLFCSCAEALHNRRDLVLWGALIAAFPRLVTPRTTSATVLPTRPTGSVVFTNFFILFLHGNLSPPRPPTDPDLLRTHAYSASCCA